MRLRRSRTLRSTTIKRHFWWYGERRTILLILVRSRRCCNGSQTGGVFCPDGDSVRSAAFLDVGAHRRADQLHWIFGAAPPALLDESALACAGKRFGMVRGPQHERRFALSKNNGSNRTNHA